MPHIGLNAEAVTMREALPASTGLPTSGILDVEHLRVSVSVTDELMVIPARSSFFRKRLLMLTASDA
jgi:hypothetical protein